MRIEKRFPDVRVEIIYFCNFLLFFFYIFPSKQLNEISHDLISKRGLFTNKPMHVLSEIFFFINFYKWRQLWRSQGMRNEFKMNLVNHIFMLI